MNQIVFRCTADTFGMPDPHVASGTVMILVQDGRADVVRYDEPTPPDNPSPSFEHAINCADLRAEALQVVRTNFPTADILGDALTFTCPPDLAARARWK